MNKIIIPSDYLEFLNEIKARIHHSRIKTFQAVNSEMILLYYDIGKHILAKQGTEGWGTKVIDHLAADLKKEFPGVKGFSLRTLKYMRKFAEIWTDYSKVQQLAAQIPWGHTITLINKVQNQAERIWYTQATIENGWSRAVLTHQIETDLYGRQGKLQSNFSKTIPDSQSETTIDLFKSEYVLDFIHLHPKANERDLENAIMSKVTEFLLELGKGFAFIGRQYIMNIGGRKFRPDLVFYHVHLHRYVIIDLKFGEFEPEFVGKMNFYLSAADELLKNEDDKESIGIILCRSKNNIIVEYTLKDTMKPMGIASYRLRKELPEDIQAQLPDETELIHSLEGIGEKYK